MKDQLKKVDGVKSSMVKDMKDNETQMESIRSRNSNVILGRKVGEMKFQKQ